MRYARSGPDGGTHAAQGALAAAAARERRARIMIVDGDPGSLRRASDALVLHGYLVEEAFDAVQAQRMLERTIPNLILADARLPGVAGLARGHALTAGRLKHVPIIALAAPRAEGHGAKALRVGYDGCITAPVDTHGLALQVAAFLVRGPVARDGDPGRRGATRPVAK